MLFMLELILSFKTYSVDDLVTSSANKADYQLKNDGKGNPKDMLSRLQLSPKEHYALSEYCSKIGIQFLSTAFGVSELNLLISLSVKAIKVPSGEITNCFLLDAMARSAVEHNLPVFISTGMCNLADVEYAFQLFIKRGVRQDRITLMHCVSSYPAPND